jgi:hypothetical protein
LVADNLDVDDVKGTRGRLDGHRRRSRGRLKTSVYLGAVRDSKDHRRQAGTQWFARGAYRFTVSATDAAGDTQVAAASNRVTVQ